MPTIIDRSCQLPLQPSSLPTMRFSTLKQKKPTRPARGVLDMQQKVAASPMSLTGTRPKSRASAETDTSFDISTGFSSRSSSSEDHRAVVFTPPSSDGSSKRGKFSDKINKRRSLYNGPQLAEPCVADALVHVLQPCGHKVLTSEPQTCGANCLGSGTEYANDRTAERFMCAVCIFRSVRDHYQARRSLFITSLDRLEQSIGGFKTGWKGERLARMAAVWRSEAIEGLTELSQLGRHCIAISVEDDLDFALTTGLSAGSSDVQTSDPAESSALSVTAPRSVRASRLPTPTITRPKHASGKSVAMASSRLPVYCRR